MFFPTATIALVAALLPAALAAPAPIQKRFTSAVIRSGRTNTCLTLALAAGEKVADGSLLTTGDCATATRWDINPGSGSVIVSGTNFALDAGVPQGNNAVAKVWTSYPTSTQQTWYLTGDNRIAVTGGNQCLDQGDNGPQTYECTTGNTNQVWYVDGAPVAPAPSSASASASASATTSFAPVSPPSASASANATTSAVSSSSAPVPSASSGPAVTSAQIKWKADQTGCLSVTSDPGDGVTVSVQACRGLTDPVVGGQLFTWANSGVIQLAGTNFCLDAGTNPSNGVGMKLWTCYPGLAQQTWNVRKDGLISTANNQCLNIDNSNFVRIQTWECSLPDVNQGWVF